MHLNCAISVMRTTSLRVFMLIQCLIFGLVGFIDCKYTVSTGTSVVIFNTTGMGIEYHGRNQETGEISENAFLVSFNNAREVTPAGEVVQILDRNRIPLAFNASESRLPPPNSELLYEEAYRVTYSSATGLEFTFWVFTKDQTITDVKTNRSISVVEGSVKYSLSMALWPFTNDRNRLEVSSNLTSLQPNSLTSCFMPDEQTDESSFLVCEAERLLGSLELLNSATAFSYATQQSTELSANVLFYACPTPEFEDSPSIISDTQIRGEFCPFLVTPGHPFPRESNEEEINPENCTTPIIPPAITTLEIRIHFENFFNSSLDYDPEISVLFGNPSGTSSRCSSDSYEIEKDVIFWLSVVAAIIALCCIFVVLLFSYTTRGRKLFGGSERTAGMTIRNSEYSNAISESYAAPI